MMSVWRLTDNKQLSNGAESKARTNNERERHRIKTGLRFEEEQNDEGGRQAAGAHETCTVHRGLFG